VVGGDRSGSVSANIINIKIEKIKHVSVSAKFFVFCK
jgi:hypothetical protein